MGVRSMIKNKLKYWLGKFPLVFRLYRYTYSLFLHKDRLMKRQSFGNGHPNDTILVIRPNSEDGIQGLMSLFVQAARWLQYAKGHNYLSFIDYKTYKTQYYDDNSNSWEFFFKQPDNLEYNEVYKSKNVVLSGVSLKKTTDDTMFREHVFRGSTSLNQCHEIINSSIRLTDEVEHIVEKENEVLHVEDCIGVYIRGTDYAKLKPTGEFRQPDIEEVIKKVREFIENHPGKKIFLVTEDNDYYKRMKAEFAELITTVSFDSFISGYDGKGYLSKSGLLEEDKKKRGIDYLVKIILLSRCRYLISSITMGSIAAYCFNGGKYEDKYIFDLGYYE